MAQSYLLTLAVCATYYYCCRMYGWGLEGVWRGLVLFFSMRAVQSTARAVTRLQLFGGQGRQDDDIVLQTAGEKGAGAGMQAVPSAASSTASAVGDAQAQGVLLQTEVQGASASGEGQAGDEQAAEQRGPSQSQACSLSSQHTI